MQPLLNIGLRAARRAADVIVRSLNRLDSLEVSSKGRNDFVSEVDRAAEAEIVATIRKAYPDHAFLCEESGEIGSGPVQWIVDPLDGTTNFLHGFPVYCVSIALAHKGVVQHGVVYDPTRNDLFTASRGGGAFLNERRIRVARRDRLIDCLLATGFPFRMFEHVDAYVAMMKDFMQKTAGIRRPGAAALDLANVAAGRMDGFWEIGLSPWDMAAGALMVQEAGGLVGDLQGNEGWLESGRIVAANPRIFPQMLQVIGAHLSPALRLSADS